MRSGAPVRTPCDGDDTDSRDTCTDDHNARMRISLLDYVTQPLRASSIHSRLPKLKQYIITNIKSKEKQWKTHFLPSCAFSMNTDSYKKSTRLVKLSALITARYYVLLRSELEKTQLVLSWFHYTVRASATDALCWAEAEERKSTQFLSMPVEAFLP